MQSNVYISIFSIIYELTTTSLNKDSKEKTNSIHQDVRYKIYAKDLSICWRFHIHKRKCKNDQEIQGRHNENVLSDSSRLVHHFLEIEITQSKDRIFIVQKKHTINLIKKFKTIATPLGNTKLLRSNKYGDHFWKST